MIHAQTTKMHRTSKCSRHASKHNALTRPQNSTTRNATTLLQDIRSVIDKVEVCKEVQCECNDVWECGKAWEALHSIETILKEYEQELQTQSATYDKKENNNTKNKDAWDVIG